MIEKRRRGCSTPTVNGSMVLRRESVQELPLMPTLCRQSVYEYPERPGSANAYHHIGDDDDQIYARTIAKARHHGVSLECPPPSYRKTAMFGLEQREFHDFANIGGGGDLRIDQLRDPLKGRSPSPCAYLWRQAAIGIADRQATGASSGHFLYPCLGPLVNLNVAPHLPFILGGREEFARLGP